MALTPGTRLGPYKVLALIGVGGMGEVYRAHDSKLNRDVALKVLPDSFANDPERLARFQREAQVLASLNHPNIAAIYGLEDADGIRALVLELVEGPTLADRIAQGPIPIEDALPIARQIAEALEAAHEHGIIHRDLKPTNIKLRPDGTVKVLDFGLAKALDPAPTSDFSQSPTITTPAMTRMGVIMGTAAYMSPEQAKGKTLDKRTDIWAFGCVLYEMLTGARAFKGDDVSDTLAAILRGDPDWNVLPAATPPLIKKLLHRCLEKDRARRLADMADARFEIEEALLVPAESAETMSTRGAASHPRERLAWTLFGVALVAAVAIGVMTYVRRAPIDTHVYRSTFIPPPSTFSSVAATIPAFRLALSPDGRRLAFIAGGPDGRGLLWVRPLDGLVAQPLAGTEDALTPFWSPDSRSIGFSAGGKLKKVDAAGGPVQTLCDGAGGNNGATWNRDDVILFSNGQIRRVAGAGGACSVVAAPNRTNGEANYWWPFFLPDSRHFLYFALGGTPLSPLGTYVASLDSNERKLLMHGGSNSKYAQGYLMFLRGTTLMAQAFDVTRLELRGDEVPVAEQVDIGGTTTASITGAFTVSDTGVLAYQTGSTDSQLVWFDRSGKQLGALGDRADYGDIALSPDDKRATVSLLDPTRKTRDIWMYDLARGLRTRFTIDPADDYAEIWSPDARRVIFSSNRKGGRFGLYQKPSSGAGSDETVLDTTTSAFPDSWSPDGRFVLYRTQDPDPMKAGLWVLPQSGDRKPFPFVLTQFNEGQGQFSPDGRWIAYVSNESGQDEVYVAAFPGPGGKSQVSASGGTQARWRRDGKELFYLAPNNTLMAAAVSGQGSGFEVGAVRPLFQTRARAGVRFGFVNYSYDVSADGQRFLVNTMPDERTSTPVTVVVNWTAELKR